MVAIFNLDKGKSKIIKKIEQSKSKPRILSFFGVPDSGKTYLIDIIGNHFESLGLKIKQRDNRECINLYESWAPYAPGEGIWFTPEEVLSYDLVMYHCPWDDRSHPWEHKADPEEALINILNRRLDLSVGVFNPRRSSVPLGNYDLVIANPKSLEKPYDFDQ